MNPCATFSPPIMYTPNEYREKNSWPLFFFFFSLKSKIKYSSKIRRYRNFSEFSVEKKYVSNDIKKRKGKEREKTFYSSKMSRRRSKLVTIHHPFDGFSKHLLPREIRQEISRVISCFVVPKIR